MTRSEALPGGGKDLAFPKEEYLTRIARVRRKMRELALDALLVYHAPNVIYLSGFQSINMYDSECFVVPLEGDPILLVPEREFGGALLYSWLDEPRIFLRTEYPDVTFREPMQGAVDALTELRANTGRIGVELRSMGVAARKRDTLLEALPDAELVDASGLVESVKAVKSPWEIEHLRHSAAMTDLGMAAAIGEAAEGKSDNDLAAAAYFAMMLPAASISRSHRLSRLARVRASSIPPIAAFASTRGRGYVELGAAITGTWLPVCARSPSESRTPA